MPLEFGGATNPAMWTQPPWWQTRKRGPKSQLPFPGLPALTGLPNVSPALPKTAMPAVQNPQSYAAGAFGNAFAQVGNQAAQQQRTASPQALQQQQQAGAQAQGVTLPAFGQTATAEPIGTPASPLEQVAAMPSWQTSDDLYNQFLAALGAGEMKTQPGAVPLAPGVQTNAVGLPVIRPGGTATTTVGTDKTVPTTQASTGGTVADRTSAEQWWNLIRAWINYNAGALNNLVGQVSLPDLGTNWRWSDAAQPYVFDLNALANAVQSGNAAAAREYLRKLNQFYQAGQGPEIPGGTGEVPIGTDPTRTTTPGGEWGNLHPEEFGDPDNPGTYTGPGGNTWDELRQFIGWTNTAGGGAWGFLTTLTPEEQGKVLKLIGRTSFPSVADLKMAGDDFIFAWAQRLAQAWAIVRGLGDEPATPPAIGDGGAAARAAEQQQKLIDQFKRYISMQQSAPAGSIRGGYSQSPTTWYY